VIDPTLPLIDLHRHLDGSVRLSTIIDLGFQYELPLPAWDVESLRPHVQVTTPQPGVMAFLAKFKWMTGVMVNEEAVRRITSENVEDAHKEGLDYVELRFSPWFMAEPHHLEPAGVVAAVVDGIEEAQRNFPVRVGLIGILSRTYGPEIAWQELEALLSLKQYLVGLDLAGDEANYPGKLFNPHLEQARLAGWQITIHAGEAAGPESIWQAIDELGASRIGHALAAIHDPQLMDYMARKRIGVEANLTSNVQTTSVASYAAHPLRTFLERGILATINTDDPGISNIDIHYEYEVAAPAAGLSPEQSCQAQRNALEVAFLSPAERTALLEGKAQ
jgi:adenosine deaminase